MSSPTCRRRCSTSSCRTRPWARRNWRPASPSRWRPSLAGLPDVRRIRSTSQLGVCQITVEFEPDADYYRSRQFVAERVAQSGSQLPPGTEPPLLSGVTGRLNEIFEFTLEAEPGAADLMTLRDLAEFDGAQPAAGGARRRGRRTPGRIPAPVPGPDRSRTHVGAARQPRRSRARGRIGQCQRLGRVRAPGRDGVVGARHRARLERRGSAPHGRRGTRRDPGVSRRCRGGRAKGRPSDGAWRTG